MIDTVRENGKRNQYVKEDRKTISTVRENGIIDQYRQVIQKNNFIVDAIYFNQDLCTEAPLIQETEWRIYLRKKLPGDLFRQALWHGGRSGKRK